MVWLSYQPSSENVKQKYNNIVCCFKTIYKLLVAKKWDDSCWFLLGSAAAPVRPVSDSCGGRLLLPQMMSSSRTAEAGRAAPVTQLHYRCKNRASVEQPRKTSTQLVAVTNFTNSVNAAFCRSVESEREGSVEFTELAEVRVRSSLLYLCLV